MRLHRLRSPQRFRVLGKNMDTTDAASVFVNRLFCGLLLMGAICALAVFSDHSTGATGYFGIALVVAMSVWAVEIADGKIYIRVWVWAFALIWWIVVLAMNWWVVAPRLMSLRAVGDTEMYLGVAVGLVGFPTSFALVFAAFYASDFLLRVDYVRYLYETFGPQAALLADCLIFLVGAILQWGLLAYYRRKRRSYKPA